MMKNLDQWPLEILNNGEERVVNRQSNLGLNCAIIINSCDTYSDVWPMFFTALKANWANCDLQIVLNTETKTFVSDGLFLNELNPVLKYNSTPINIKWGQRLISVLESINKDYVICLFDDFILEREVNLEKIEKCLHWMEEDRAISVFYFNHIPGSNATDDSYNGFERIGPTNDYRLNSAPAIWRRQALIQYTGKIDNPWAWEVFGSYRTFNRPDKFYCSKRSEEDIFVYNYHLGGAIRRGKWVKSVVLPIAEKYDLEIDFSKRGFADEDLRKGKYSLLWKLQFFALGLRMVGLSALVFFYRALKKKFTQYGH